jgi:hypothetical protein
VLYYGFYHSEEHSAAFLGQYLRSSVQLQHVYASTLYDVDAHDTGICTAYLYTTQMPPRDEMQLADATRTRDWARLVTRCTLVVMRSTRARLVKRCTAIHTSALALLWCTGAMVGEALHEPVMGG